MTPPENAATKRHYEYALLCSTGDVHTKVDDPTILPHARDLADQVCVDSPHTMAHRLLTGWMEWTP